MRFLVLAVVVIAASMFVGVDQSDARGTYCSRHPSAESCVCYDTWRETEYNSQRCVDWRVAREQWFAERAAYLATPEGQAELAEQRRREETRQRGLAILIVLPIAIVAGLIALIVRDETK